MNIVKIILAEIKGSHLKQVSFCACPVCKEHLSGKVQKNSGIQSRQVLMSLLLSLSLSLSLQLHSCQEMLSTQLENAVIKLLSQFISADFGKLEKLKENQEIASLGKQCWSSCSEASFVYVLLHSPHVLQSTSKPPSSIVEPQRKETQKMYLESVWSVLNGYKRKVEVLLYSRPSLI